MAPMAGRDDRDRAAAARPASFREETPVPSDKALMQASAQGDLQAFEQLVLRHQQAAWKLAARFLGNPTDAGDIVQKAFLKILSAAPRYRPTAAFRTYLYCVLSRLCLDHHRRSRTFLDADTAELASPDPSPAGTLLAAERDRAVRTALQGLPPRQRMAIVLKYYNELGYQEIAAALEISQKAVERLLARGRESLERELSPLLGE